jgi:hypothetical protein
VLLTFKYNLMGPANRKQFSAAVYVCAAAVKIQLMALANTKPQPEAV